MKTYRLAADLSLIDVAPPISGFDGFIGVYVLRAGEIGLVDVGPSVSIENLVSGLADLGISPAEVSYLLTTHIHIDHAGGVGKALRHMPNARVVLHEKGVSHLVAPTSLWKDTQRALGQHAFEYGAIEPVPRDKIITAKGGMVIDLGGMRLEALDTPGHAPHHLSFFDRKGGRLFVGDAAGTYHTGLDFLRPATNSPFELKQALDSLDRLTHLAPRSLYYTHFGATDNAVDKLQRHKRQLVLWGRIIARCLEKGASYQEMREQILTKDVMLAPIDKLPPDEYQRELFFINNSITGFVDYFKRNGTGSVERLS